MEHALDHLPAHPNHASALAGHPLAVHHTAGPFNPPILLLLSRSRSRSTTLTFVLVCFLWQGVWIYTCFIHRFVDARRKDYFVMYAHHVVTIALVGTCHRSDGPRCPPTGLQNNTLLAPPTLLAPRSSLQLAPLLAPTTASVFWCCSCTTLATSRWTC